MASAALSASRLRYALGLGLASLSLAAAAYFSLIYLRQRLWLGLAATCALGGLIVAGVVSFSRARRRRLRDLMAFADVIPAPGTLRARREAELAALRARGGRPDLAACAQRAQAELQGEAYFGRYFVAMAVLVGLLGTFAGLMETLSGVSALLRDDSTQSLSAVVRLLATPLAGLHVTFGASMVGILATATLALLQGDLGVLDEELLGRLEEHTAHVLAVQLWPPGEEPGAQAVAELSALRGELPRLLERLEAAAAEAARRLEEAEARAADRVAACAESYLERATTHAARVAEALTHHATQLGDLLDARARQSSEALLSQARRVSAEAAQLLRQLAEQEMQRQADRRAAEQRLLQEVAVQTGACAEASRQGMAEALVRLTEVGTGLAVRAQEAAGEVLRGVCEAAQVHLSEATRALLSAQTALLEAEQRRAADHEALRERLQRLLEQGIAQPLSAQMQLLRETASATSTASAGLSASTGALAEAASRFAEATGQLVQSLSLLAPELSALSAEVALLSARTADEETGPGMQLLGELCRLTDSIERLVRRDLSGREVEHAPPSSGAAGQGL